MHTSQRSVLRGINSHSHYCFAVENTLRSMQFTVLILMIMLASVTFVLYKKKILLSIYLILQSFFLIFCQSTVWILIASHAIIYPNCCRFVAMTTHRTHTYCTVYCTLHDLTSEPMFVSVSVHPYYRLIQARMVHILRAHLAIALITNRVVIVYGLVYPCNSFKRKRGSALEAQFVLLCTVCC